MAEIWLISEELLIKFFLSSFFSIVSEDSSPTNSDRNTRPYSIHLRSWLHLQWRFSHWSTFRSNLFNLCDSSNTPTPLCMPFIDTHSMEVQNRSRQLFHPVSDCIGWFNGINVPTGWIYCSEVDGRRVSTSWLTYKKMNQIEVI